MREIKILDVSTFSSLVSQLNKIPVTSLKAQTKPTCLKKEMFQS